MGKQADKKPIRIVITSGDADGIGTEIVAKALSKLGPKQGIHFILWRTPSCPRRHLRQIDSEFDRITVSSWHEALEQKASYKEIVDINSKLSPAQWVEISAQASFYGHIDAIATAPLSKLTIQEAKMKDIGHTDILKRVTGAEELFMAFLGKRFNVLLATGHIPLKNVSRALTHEKLTKALQAAHSLAQLLPGKQGEKPIALVGCNPHAGEQGLIGEEESVVFEQALGEVRKKGLRVEGPLVPDVAFFEENWKKYSVYVTPYHDQGLIPFKMIHGRESGVHITMGLPFYRTSVDHGTAKNIFGMNRADATSMYEALIWAIRLARQHAGHGTVF